jgi:uncharacterized membrane protein YcaP (DUF421 family)
LYAICNTATKFLKVQHINWSEIFLPDKPLLEIIVRGTVMYLSLFILLRVILRREAGNLGITDILVIVLLSDAAQNGMAGNYNSITDGVLLVAVIIVWSHLLDWLSYRYKFFDKLIKPSKIIIVKDGKMIKTNMRKELITEEELMSKVRGEGLDKLEEVKMAYMEHDGNITVIK